MVAILILVVVVALFDLATVAFGVDSSDLSVDPRLPARPSI
jgi:hypothetical protein